MTDEEFRKLDLGGQLAEDFRQWEAYCNGEPNECDVVEYTPKPPALTGRYIQEIRKKVARSTRKFEALFGVQAQTMEAYEAGEQKPDAAMIFLLRSIELDPDGALRVVRSLPNTVSYPVIYERAKDGGWGAFPPDLPGVGIGAETLEAARESIKIAIEMQLDGLREDGLPIPPPSLGGYVEVSTENTPRAHSSH